MKNIGTKDLETNRLILRRVRLEDVEDMFNNYTSSKEVTKYLSWKPHQTVNVTKKYVNHLLENYLRDNYYEWVIELKQINQIIGAIGANEINEKLKMIHIGYCLGEKWWNKGIMTEALTRVLSFFFEEVEVNRIEAIYDSKNIASGKVMMKCNMKYEGTLRQRGLSNQGLFDTSYYAILKSDFEMLKNKNIHQMKLYSEPFQKIKAGTKTHELRLNDEKRQKIKIGDKIMFSNISDLSQKLLVIVENLHYFSSFNEMYKNIPLDKCGYNKEQDASYLDMYDYYQRDDEKKYGVLAIEIKRINKKKSK